jgi:hypothetical protein
VTAPKRTRRYLLRLYMARSGHNTFGELAQALGVTYNSAQAWGAGVLPVATRLGELAGVLGMTDAELGEYVRGGEG